MISSLWIQALNHMQSPPLWLHVIDYEKPVQITP